MSVRVTLVGALLSVMMASALAAQQQNATLLRAVSAYDGLEYEQAIVLARRAQHERLSAVERERSYEILGFAYASLDSTRRATDAFKEVILLNPDRELDPTRISPKITNLFALALGEVLVIRHFQADTTTFVAGTGALPIAFTITRTARVRTRIVGPGGEARIDSVLADGVMHVRWNGLLDGGRAAVTGVYRVIVEATSEHDSYAASFPIHVEAGPVDTIAHLTKLPGYDLLPETEIPPRSWRPLGLTFVAASAIAGSSIALRNRALGAGGTRELLTISAGTVLVGALATFRKPSPVPALANIRYDALIREQLARQNAEITAENITRRRLVLLAVTPEAQPGPAQ